MTAPRATITGVRTLVCDTGQKRAFVFVLVDTDAGLTGLGEGSQGDQDAAVVANVRQLAPRFIGRSPLDAVEAGLQLLAGDRTGRAMYVAVSAIEQALWDLAGKLLGVPVYQLLGGAPRPGPLRCYATMAAGLEDVSPDGLAREAERCVAAGYDAVKAVPFRELRAVALDSPAGRRAIDLGVRRLAGVREAVGPDVDVLVECAFSFDAATAVRIGRLIEPYSCLWLEAPLRWDDPAELARIRGAVPQRLASGEALHGRRAFRDLIERQAVDVLQPDVKWTGGIFEAKKIAAWAEAYQLAVAPHNNSGPVATAASAHLAATLPNFLILETPSRVPPWQEEATRGSGVVRRGRVDLADLAGRPGLGVDLDEAVAWRWETQP
jgi:galactonate dehydratase